MRAPSEPPVSRRDAPTAVAGNVGVSPRRVLIGLLLVIAALLTLHAISQVARFQLGRPTLLGITARVYFGAEASIPAWFSSSLMLVCAMLLLWIGSETRRRRRPDARYWVVVGVVFVALSVDEAAVIHEGVSPAFAGITGWLAASVGGVFVPLSRKPGYAWAIPGLLLTAALGIAVLGFLRRLPPRTRRLFVLSGLVFLAGAVGMELAGGAYSGEFGADDPTFVALLTIEETLEMSGLSLFVYSLLSHVASAFGTLTLPVTPLRPEGREPAGGTAAARAS